MEIIGVLLRLLVMTAVVAGLAYATSRYLRQRWQGLARGRHLELIDAMPVGNRQHLALVRVGGRVVCLGITHDQVRPVLVLEPDDARGMLKELGRDV